MIERFAVTNFKSIKDRLEVDFSPGSGRAKSEHISENGCLRAIAVFGANASGKSNIIKALKFVKKIITDPSYETQYPIYNWDSGSDITEFEIDFTIGTEMDGYSTYSYAVKVRTRKLVSDKTSTQSYKYDIVMESLSVTDPYFETTNVFLKDDSNSGTIYIDKITELDEKQIKLKEMQDQLEMLYSKLNAASKELAVAERDKERKEREREAVERAYKTAYLITFEDLAEIYHIDEFESRLGKNWKNKALNHINIVLGRDNDRWDFGIFPFKINNISLNYNNKNEQSEETENAEKKSRLSTILDDIDLKTIDQRVDLLKEQMLMNQGVEYAPGQRLPGIDDRCSEVLLKVHSKLNRINSGLKRLDDIIKECNKKIGPLNSDIKDLVEKIENARNEESSSNEDHVVFNESILQSGQIDNYLTNDFNEKKTKIEELRKKVEKAYRWFVSTLFILETDDYYLPINNPNLLTDLSNILSALDVGICGLNWEGTYNDENNRFYSVKEIDLIKSKLSNKDWKRISECQKNSVRSSCSSSLVVKTDSELNLFTYYMGEETVKKLIAYHNRKNTNGTNILSESDGTRRLIELASILLPTDSEKVFIVDELDRRLHTSLTLKFIELFLGEGNENKQLIFVTHESRLMTTEIFRPDEIRLASMKDGTTILDRLDGIIKKDPGLFNKRTDWVYLEEKLLPGVPRIPKIEN